MFDRMVNQLSAAAATTSTGGAQTTSAQAAAALMRFGGINADRTQDEEPIREEDGLLNIDTAEKMLKWHAEAIGRCVELSPSNDVYVMILRMKLGSPVSSAPRIRSPYSAYLPRPLVMVTLRLR